MSVRQFLVYGISAVLVCIMHATGAAAQLPPPPGSIEIRYDNGYGEYPDFLFEGSALFVDFDGQDYMDLVMTGLLRPIDYNDDLGPGFGGIFTHRSQRAETSLGVFDTLRYYDRRTVEGFTNFYHTALAASDYNNDGRPDIAATGRTRTDSFVPFAMLVEQVDSLRFAIRDPGWLPVQKGSLAWGDYDNDGKSDLLLTGQSISGPATRLYRNIGDGTFQNTEVGLPDIGFGEAVWGDSDNDGDLDILITGAGENGRPVTDLYVNNGGSFVRAGLNLPDIVFGQIRFVDFNADGLLDIVITGAELSPFLLEGAFFIYLNEGGNSFAPTAANVRGHFDGDFDLIDWDADGDIDVLASGYIRPTGSRQARLYINEGGEFNRRFEFIHVIDMVFATGDYDRDNDPDLFVTGYDSEPFTLVPPVATFYVTEGRSNNAPPSSPGALRATAAGGWVHLSWAPGVDDITPTPSLTYNVRVGTSPGGVDIVSPLADPGSGKRFVCEQGNVFHNTSWQLEGLPPGTYYWSVQAIDQACVGSNFASEGLFVVGGDVTSAISSVPQTSTEFHPAFPNPFSDQTILRFSVPKAASAKFVVYDLLARPVRTLLDAVLAPGEHSLVWDGKDDRASDLPAGLYVCRLETPGYVQWTTVILVR